MAKIFMTVKHTFVHAYISDCCEAGRTSRSRASSAPARETPDARALDQKSCAAESENCRVRAIGGFTFENLSLLQHDEEEHVSVHAHSGPSQLDMAAEGMLGGCVSETKVVDHLWGRAVAQRKDENIISFASVGMSNKNTLSVEVEEHNASALVYHGSTHQVQEPIEHFRGGQVRNLSFCSTAPMSLPESAECQFFSTSPLFPREEQLGYCKQLIFGSAPTTRIINPTHDATHAAENRTRGMLMYVPYDYTSSKLLRTIDSERFTVMYDFMSLPVIFVSRCTLHFPFVL
eukprot:TRINITY_DN8015_c2_g2_i1.p1 TRINITY_DN8015_c2_g2~~TRINITY_DN8015_c2_g2_i1.p1  ORF type:complete len:289 (-),score=28.52 TRINITY_DN8015_c2_g2_i1:3-869(-)